MNIKQFLKSAFAAVTAISMIVLIRHWFMEAESSQTVTTLLVLNVIALILALPSSILAAAVGGAWYALELDPRSGDGVFLNTVLLSVIGTVQWFWLERFWYPKEAVFNRLDIV